MADKYHQIKGICLALLTRREHSQKELQDKLALRGFSRSDSHAVIAELAQQGWQSDQRYAESYSRHRIQKGYGSLRITYELKQRGIDEFDLELIIDELSVSWQGLIEKVYLGKFSNDVHLTAKEWQKRNRFLQQRGFNGSLIKALFSQLGIELERKKPIIPNRK